MVIGIGEWVRRGTGKWHLVDSTVAGDVFTRCGRRMDYINRNVKLEVASVMPLTRMIGQPQLCFYCEISPSIDSTG